MEKKEKQTSKSQMVRPSVQPLADGKDTVPAPDWQRGQGVGDKSIPSKAWVH